MAVSSAFGRGKSGSSNPHISTGILPPRVAVGALLLLFAEVVDSADAEAMPDRIRPLRHVDGGAVRVLL